MLRQTLYFVIVKDKKSLQCGNLVLQLSGELVLVLVLTAALLTAGLSVAALVLLLTAPGHLLAAGLVLLTLRLVLTTSSHHLLLLLLLTDVRGAVLCVTELLVTQWLQFSLYRASPGWKHFSSVQQPSDLAQQTSSASSAFEQGVSCRHFSDSGLPPAQN